MSDQTGKPKVKTERDDSYYTKNSINIDGQNAFQGFPPPPPFFPQQMYQNDGGPYGNRPMHVSAGSNMMPINTGDPNGKLPPPTLPVVGSQFSMVQVQQPPTPVSNSSINFPQQYMEPQQHQPPPHQPLPQQQQQHQHPPPPHHHTASQGHLQTIFHSRETSDGEYPNKKRYSKSKIISLPRRRALTACNTCRTKKVKCDNLRPRCSSCIKNGIDTCEYVNEDQIKDITNYDSVSIKILEKLESIQDELRDIKGEKATKFETLTRPSPNDQWNMSFTSILKWDYFKSKVPGIVKDYDEMERTLSRSFALSNLPPDSDVLSIEDRFHSLKVIESVFYNSLSQCVNSFFVNCHTKVPVLDTLKFIEAIELYRSLHKLVPGFSLLKLGEDFEKTKLFDKPIGDLYIVAMENGLQDMPFRRSAYFNLCEYIPIIPLVCALGILSSPVQLDNFAKYKTSLEERSDLSTSCLTQESIDLIPDILPKERLAIATWMITLSKSIPVFFPKVFHDSSINSILYHIFLSQFDMYILKPISAYKNINMACQNMMTFLDRRRDQYQRIIYKRSSSKAVVERLFWICLKLECELRTELSPKCSKSGITSVEPPCEFPTIPDSIIDEFDTEEDQIHSKECIQIATKLDDQYTWYYFLTEIATRKVDNDMYGDYYTNEAFVSRSWDQPKFYQETFWISFIKYLNQYNGIINSLSPKIRNFILQEVDIDQVFKSVYSAYERRRANESSEDDITSDLNQFLIDNSLLVQSQSESIMYMKTRILASKLLLFRPMIYLILNDRIPIQELLAGLLSFLTESDSQSMLDSSSHSLFSDTSSSNDAVVMEYDKILDAPLYYQRKNTGEDFSNFFSDNAQGTKSSMDETYFKIDLLPKAKQQIIRLFFLHLRSLPKLNIPKLAAHRHPGQWYYLRNLLVGNFYMFLLYKKLQEIVLRIQQEPELQQLMAGIPAIQSIGALDEALDSVISRSLVVSTLEHALLVYDYWKDEATDCLVYADLIQRCLDDLNQDIQ